MPLDPRHVGRTYGPFRYGVGQEKISDFAIAVGGGVPGRVFGGLPPEDLHPWFLDEAAGKASPHGSTIAPPTFCVNFAMQPFALACSDPELGIDLVRLLHGEQQFEYFDVVRPGDILETGGEIVRIESKGTLDFMTVKTTTRNQTGKVVLEGLWTAVVRG
jgi:acyl dehydratase